MRLREREPSQSRKAPVVARRPLALAFSSRTWANARARRPESTRPVLKMGQTGELRAPRSLRAFLRQENQGERAMAKPMAAKATAGERKPQRQGSLVRPPGVWGVAVSR